MIHLPVLGDKTMKRLMENFRIFLKEDEDEVNAATILDYPPDEGTIERKVINLFVTGMQKMDADIANQALEFMHSIGALDLLKGADLSKIASPQRGRLNFSGMDLSYTNFSKDHNVGASGRFNESDFSGADLTGAKFQRTELNKTWFNNATLDQADFRIQFMEYAQFENCDLSQAAVFKGPGMANVVAQGANFINTTWHGINMAPFILPFARFQGADLSQSKYLDMFMTEREASKYYMGLDEAEYDDGTFFPPDFDPEKAFMKKA